MKYINENSSDGSDFYNYAKALAILNENLANLMGTLDAPEKLQAKNAQLGVLIAINTLIKESFGTIERGASTTMKRKVEKFRDLTPAELALSREYRKMVRDENIQVSTWFTVFTTDEGTTFVGREDSCPIYTSQFIDNFVEDM